LGEGSKIIDFTPWVDERGKNLVEKTDFGFWAAVNGHWRRFSAFG
jgi:hypothetical protein